MTVELSESRRLVTIFTALVTVLTVAVPIRTFRSLLEDPCVSLVADFRHEWQIVAAEARRILPFVAVLVEPSNGHVVAWTVLRFVLPNGSTDATEANLVNRMLGSGWVNSGGAVNQLASLLVGNAIDSGALERHIVFLRGAYRSRLATMHAALAEHVGDIATWTKPLGGYFVWITLKADFETAAVKPRALEAGV